MTPFRRMTRHERVGIAVVLGVSVGLLIAVCTWILLSNQARIGEIQDSRISGSEIACQQQNERHERAYAKIEAAAAIQRIKNPDRYRATVAKARELETFLNAIQPQEDCSLRARRLIVQTLGQNHAKPRKPVRKPGPLRLPPL